MASSQLSPRPVETALSQRLGRLFCSLGCHQWLSDTAWLWHCTRCGAVRALILSTTPDVEDDEGERERDPQGG